MTLDPAAPSKTTPAEEAASERPDAHVAALEAANAALQRALEQAQAEKSAVLQSALDCIITIDQDSHVVEWNPMAEQTFGYARDDAVNHDMAELIVPPHYRGAHRRGLAHYLATGEGPVLGRRIEVEAQRADGSTFPVELAITPTPIGGRTLFTAYLRDITEPRRAEAAVRESEAHFRAIADNIAQMAWMARPDGSRYWFNRRWHEYTGLRPETAEGFGWHAVHHADHLERVRDGMRRAWDAGEPWEDTFPLRRHDGEYRWFLTRAVPVYDQDGEVTLWFGTNTDITAQRESEAALERLVEERTAALLREVEERRKAEEALRQGEKLQAIGQLTGGIAHDFNNILQVVSSGATLLRHPKLSEERRASVLEGLTKATENAKTLTSRLLAFARKQALQPEAFDLNARLAGMAELLRHTLGSRIEVESDFGNDLWQVTADPSQLEVAVLNLAVNSRDAMLPDGGVLTLQTRNATLEAAPDRAAGDYVCLAVKDTGPGMSPAVMARVFEPFFTTKGPDKGTGLGLAQAHGFAKQSGGDIKIESTPGYGTAVFFHLPRASAAALADAAIERPTDRPAAHPMQQAAGRTVLVVEDNLDVASFACTMLEGLGYMTRTAANATDALMLLENGGPVDAVFSDVMMPGPMNGLQLASALRLRYPRLAVVLATGYSEVLAEWNGRAVAEVLGKPYRLDELAAALERAFRAVGTMEPGPPGTATGEEG